MKETILKLLFVAFAISAIVFFIGSSNGLWGDSESIKTKSSSAIDSRLIP